MSVTNPVIESGEMKSETLRRWAERAQWLYDDFASGDVLLPDHHPAFRELIDGLTAAADAAQQEENDFADYLDDVEAAACQHCGSDQPHGNCEACADKAFCLLCGQPLNGERGVHNACVLHEQFLADCPEMYLQTADGGVAAERKAAGLPPAFMKAKAKKARAKS